VIIEIGNCNDAAGRHRMVEQRLEGAIAVTQHHAYARTEPHYDVKVSIVIEVGNRCLMRCKARRVKCRSTKCAITISYKNCQRAPGYVRHRKIETAITIQVAHREPLWTGSRSVVRSQETRHSVFIFSGDRNRDRLASRAIQTVNSETVGDRL